MKVFDWLPQPFKGIAIGVVVLFMLVSALRIIKLILDAIPFA